MTDLQNLKTELSLGCQIMHKTKLVEMTGHLSARVDAETIIMSPRQGPGQTKPEDILMFDMEGRLVAGTGEPNSETIMHLVIYNQRPDVMSIAHTHSDMCVVLGSLSQPMRPIHNNGAILGPEVAVYPEIGLIQTREKALRMAEALGNHRALLLRGHGAVVTGSGIKETVIAAIRLEYCARLQVIAMSCGSPYYFSEDEVRDVSEKFNLNRSWDYFLNLART